jgi:hypothetical protein
MGVPVLHEKSMPSAASVSARCTWRGAVLLQFHGVATAVTGAAAAAASSKQRGRSGGGIVRRVVASWLGVVVIR